MRGWKTTCVGIVATLAGGAAAQDALVRTPEARQVEVAATISIRQSDPGWFVFLVYRGPYWKAGTEFESVRSYLEEHGITGPMIARYSRNPMSPAETAPYVEIGSFVDEAHEPRPPFEKAWRNVQTAACMIIEDRAATTRRDYTAIAKWIDRRGYRAAGPVTEIYHHGASTGGAKRIRTEIHVALDISGSLSNIATPEPSPESAKSPSQEVRHGLDTRVSHPLKTGATGLDAAESSPEARSSAPTAPPLEPEVTLSELVDAGRFDEVAGRVVPLDRDLSGAMQIWLGQIVFRVGAIAKGVERVSPKDALPIRGIGDALRRRYRVASANLELNPLDHAVVHVDTRHDAHAAEKRAVMHRLDALMSRIALGTIEVEDVKTKTVDILRQIQELTQPPADRQREPDKDGTVANPM